jgi:hypothetical protein
MSKRHRPQKQKRGKVRHVQELRRSNAAGAHKNRARYNRNDKWCEDDVDCEETPEELGL